MTKAKAHAYRWIGTLTIDGRPHKHIGNSDVPPEDLSAEWVEAATPDQIKRIDANPDLYKPIGKAEYEKEHAAPKWYTAIQERATLAGKETPARNDGETEAAYNERVDVPSLFATSNPTGGDAGEDAPVGDAGTESQQEPPAATE